MTNKGSIQICHSDETLVAETAFWAGSAGYQLVALPYEALRTAAPDAAAIILELSGSSDSEVDVIEALSKRTRAKIMAITQLDTKTIASVRRLFQAKSVDLILLPRADFTTRQISDLIKSREVQPALDRDSLAEAITDGHVVVHYQPKVPFRPGESNFGVEALCRIKHPELGMIYPDAFIPLAEAHDLILELTDAVTVQAFRDMRAWDEAGRHLRMAINISPRLMGSMTWFELFEHRCQEHKADPKRITLEVTESSSQGGKVLALEILSRLRLKGFLLSIDDFGTGFSSLETLYKLPFGELKIDKGFVFDLLKSAEARTLVESTVSLARKLGLKICAEGVETEELFQELRNLQCDDAQGYFISKPVAADSIVPFFSKWEADLAAKGNAPAARLKAIHGMLADILSGPDDEEDATVVFGSAASSPAAESAADIAARIPALVLGDDLTGALALTQRALAAGPEAGFRGKLESLQAEIEHSLLSPALMISDGRDIIQVVGGESFTIGRESPSAPADITIPCRWLSRGTKNLRLSYENGQWLACDLGSTNGHFMDGVRLPANKPTPLPEGETLLEVGKTGNEPAPAWLKLRITPEGAAVLTFGMPGSEDDTAIAGQKWLLVQREASLGKSPQAALTIADSAADFAADIGWRKDGLWLTPRSGGSITVGGHEFSQSLPLPSGCDVSFGVAVWRVEKDKASLPKARVSSSPATAYA
jgi:EAL domain-containing protein (putative c-di-GMP-specific phosphodiesterase class I)